MKVFAYLSALCRLNLILLKVVKQNVALELFINMYVIVGQWYYYIVERRHQESQSCNLDRLSMNIYMR